MFQVTVEKKATKAGLRDKTPNMEQIYMLDMKMVPMMKWM